MDYTRQPCPYRIFYDAGASFALGVIGGGLFGCLRGLRNAPSGIVRRLRGGIDGFKMTAPRMGGSFASWGIAFSASECAVTHLRGKEDAWNPIISGVISGGALGARRGLPAMISGGLVGGIILGLMEGANIVITRLTAEQFAPKPIQELE